MIDQTEGTAPRAAVVPPRPVLSSEGRASLEAVRVAREAAQVRARRQTVQTRFWFAMGLASLAAAGFVLAPRIAHRWHARHAPATAHAAARAVESVAPPVAKPAAPVTPPPAAAAAAPAPRAPAAEVEALARPAFQLAAPAAQPAAKAAAAADEACDTASIRHAPWRLSPDACARAFDADPNNAALALAVAHASLVRGRFADATQWATRTLSLDPKAAEAYVILARAGVAEGRQDDARTAYEHYLEMAPRGWHKKEARAAIDRAGSSVSPASTPAR
jgi:tetratricopeptide (TPR) repeat protein